MGLEDYRHREIAVPANFTSPIFLDILRDNNIRSLKMISNPSSQALGNHSLPSPTNSKGDEIALLAHRIARGVANDSDEFRLESLIEGCLTSGSDHILKQALASAPNRELAGALASFIDHTAENLDLILTVGGQPADIWRFNLFCVPVAIIVSPGGNFPHEIPDPAPWSKALRRACQMEKECPIVWSRHLFSINELDLPPSARRTFLSALLSHRGYWPTPQEKQNTGPCDSTKHGFQCGLRFLVGAGATRLGNDGSPIRGDFGQLTGGEWDQGAVKDWIQRGDVTSVEIGSPGGFTETLAAAANWYRDARFYWTAKEAMIDAAVRSCDCRAIIGIRFSTGTGGLELAVLFQDSLDRRVQEMAWPVSTHEDAAGLARRIQTAFIRAGIVNVKYFHSVTNDPLFWPTDRISPPIPRILQ